MKSIPALLRLLLPAAAVWIVPFLLLGGVSPLFGDEFDRVNGGGDFFDGQWVNRTQTPPGGPPVMGNPGGGDIANFGFDLTSSGGSVMALNGGGATLTSGGGVTLTLTGSFNAQTAGGFTLIGPGTLNVQQVGGSLRIASGLVNAQSGSAVVSGGSLVIQNYTPGLGIDISNGGSVMAQTLADGAGGGVSTHGYALRIKTRSITSPDISTHLRRG